MIESSLEGRGARGLRWLIDQASILCVAQIVACAVALPFVLATASVDTWARRGLMFLHALVYGSVGVLLRYIVNAEQRARTLGLLLLCFGTVFAAASVRGAEGLDGKVLAPLVLLFAIRADALTPYIAWRFASDFPQIPDTLHSRRMLSLARGLSLTLSVTLVVAGLLAIQLGDATGLLAYLTRSGPHSLYFQLQYVLAIAAFVTLIARARRASLDERHRVSLLVGGIVLGPLPTMVWIILWTLIPGFGEIFPLRYAGWIIYPAMLATPGIAAYAVVARRAFGVAILFRRAVEHALSRYSAILLLSTPAIALMFTLYRHREERLADALSVRNDLTVFLLLAVAIAGLMSQRALLDRIDRAFFRDRYDARHVTAKLVDDCRWVGTREELASLLSNELDEALHVEYTWLFLLDRSHAEYAADEEQGTPLAADTPLVSLISAAEQTFEFDPEARPASALTRSDLAWLDNMRVRCLVPMHDAGANLLGFMALGRKRSSLPFTIEDRALLKSVARAAELTLAYHRLSDDKGAPSSPAVEGPLSAQECVSCGLVVAEPVERCPACTGRLVECPLPAIVGGTFKIVARVGAGAMGTVYHAIDTELRRSVALKTLPYVSPDAAATLRREAHIMASVEHEAVATVHGVQSWEGKPIIVYEFLAGGTLADRIVRGPLPITEVVSLGIAIAAGLSAIHDAGMLHGDIKPSNIGFTAAGRPKLLDFGIAAPVHSLGGRAEHPSLAGTLAYLAPQLAGGGIATFDSEVWSLAMTLYEAATGCQPMIGADFPETIGRVRSGRVPPVSDYLPDAPPELVRFFSDAFSRDGRHRMTTASAARVTLLRVCERMPIGT